MSGGIASAAWPPAAPGRRRLLLHAGLHKTGTTALQKFLHREAGALAGRGVLYPRTGRIGRSFDHHSIAWQLTGDRRYRAELGTLDQLAAEIAAFDGDAIVSSEGFGTLLAAPDGLAPLLRHPALGGHDLTLLLYLRDQASFSESLFFEMLKHGMAEEAARFGDAVLTQGQVRYREWTFHFDYWALAERIAAEPGLTLAVRAYADLAGGSTVSDFLGFAGLGGVAAGDLGERANPRGSLGDAVVLFCRHRTGWPPEQDPPPSTPIRLSGGRVLRMGLPAPAAPTSAASDGLRASVEELAQGGAARWSPAMRSALAARFDGGNRRLIAAAGLAPGALAIAPAGPPGSLALERVFSRDLQAAVLSRQPEPLAAVFAAARQEYASM